MADHTPHHETLSTCPNCGFSLAGAAPEPPRYCARCGQETVLHPPSVAEFFHEFVGHYVALEGALWHTLRLLLLKPGQLTKEYLAGRRQRYVLPLRLYLSASFLFFLVAKFAPSDEQFVFVRLHDGKPQVVAASSASASAPASVASWAAMPPLCGSSARGACGWLERKMDASRQELEADPERASAEFKAHFLAKAPYAMFFMLPVFAAVLALAYRGRRMRFGEHLVFCMHLMSFWFLLSALADLLPDFFGMPLFIVGAVYGVKALHVVHGGRWAWTILRALVVALVYGVLLALGIGVMTMAVMLA